MMSFKGLEEVRSVRKAFFQAVKMSLFLFIFLGCARVSIDSKQPIKLDVTMRLDIYQHVNRDVDSIENMITGQKTSSTPKEASLKTSYVIFKEAAAYAEEGGSYPQEVMQAIESRKARRDTLVSLEAKGIVGENANGLVEVKASGDDSAGPLVAQENSDRKLIYTFISKKNSASFDETARIYARRIQSDAPSGTPVETQPGSWSVK
jgi:uncharacterized protein